MLSCLKKYPFNFCFFHNTLKLDSVLAILKDGYIKAGTDVPKKYRTLGGEEGSEKIFGQIYFNDLKNTIPWGIASFIIDKNILCDMNVEFHIGWGGWNMKEEYKLNKTDKETVRKNKLDSIRKFLKNPSELPKILRESQINNHEIMFDKNISVKKYVVGIVYNFEDKKQLEKIQKLINKKKYNIKLIPNDGKIFSGK